jgi:hypothetical protein
MDLSRFASWLGIMEAVVLCSGGISLRLHRRSCIKYLALLMVDDQG